MFASLNSNGFEHDFQKIRDFRQESKESSRAISAGLQPNAIEAMNKLNLSTSCWVESLHSKAMRLRHLLSTQHCLWDFQKSQNVSSNYKQNNNLLGN
jgi:hypothetical protein